MTTNDWALILLLFLCVVLTGALLFLLLLRSPSSKTPSPTPTSTPPTPSVDPTMVLATTMVEMMQKESQATRTLMETLMLGREPTTSSETSTPFSPEQATTWDYDQTPLAPGIEATLEREAEEDVLLPLLREREESQRRIAELQEEIARNQARSESEDSSPGPWVVPEATTPNGTEPEPMSAFWPYPSPSTD
jgi:hypothetical protein